MLGAGIVGLVAVGVLGYLVFQKGYVEVNRYPIPCEFGNGLRIVQISDLHGKTKFLNGSLSRLVNGLDADLVCVTGDLASRQRQLPRVIREIAKIRAKHGIFFVPGNYEKEESVGLGFRKRMIDGDSYRPLVEGVMRVLVNEEFEVEVGESKVWIYGLDNSIYGNERYTAEPCAGDGCFKLFLAHSPNAIHFLEENGLQGHLLLTGHTHGGQVRVFGRTFGAYKHFHTGVTRLGSGLYFAVNRGLGTVKIPFRVQCLPDIAVYEVEQQKR